MSVCPLNPSSVSLPPETRLLKEVRVRLIDSLAGGERERHDRLLEQEHYLGNANAIGQVLRYVAAYQGEWVAARTFTWISSIPRNCGCVP